MRNIKLIIQYDGTNFHGFSAQKSKRTVEGEIALALNKIFKEDVKVIVASRTDAGVHALGQVVNFYLNNVEIPSDKILFVLNKNLPPDIKVLSSEEVDLNFNARFNARGKVYYYLCYHSKVSIPMLRNYALNIPYNIDIERIKSATKSIIGEFDFEVYKFRGSSSKNYIKNIYKFDVVEIGIFFVFLIFGSGFLYKMVRGLVGTMIEVGRGRIKQDEIKSIILNKERQKIGSVLSPQGLYLIKVVY